MRRSMLAAVRDAMFAGAADHVLEEDQTDAQASKTEQETEMSDDQKPAGATQNAGIPKAEHEAAVKAAEEKGRADGARAANDRLAAALGADGVKGNAARMAAVLDLAQKSPGMSGEAIAEFVAANVSADAGGAAAYEQERAAAAGLAQPGKPKPQEAASSMWDKAVARVNGG